jgi:hypothetical protein
MTRLTSVLFVVGAACSPHTPNGADLCTTIPTPAACAQQCDPTPGASNTCPGGFHCSPDGKCDAQCTPSGGQCGDGYTCTSDGQCMNDGSGSSDPGPDASCPAVHYTPTKVTPSIELLLDRSGSMDGTDIPPTRFQALKTGLTGASGAVTTTQTSVYFGAALFAADQTPCLNMIGYTAPRALNNATAIDTLIANHPPNGGNTPTAAAISQITADFALNPPPMGSPPIILLATDGEPNSCDGSTATEPGDSLAAVGAAYVLGIKTYIVGLANLNTGYLQEVANVGVGMPQNTGTAPYYTANSPQQLVDGFNAIINGALSCDLTISGQIDPSQASSGTITLNGVMLTYGTDWTLDPNGMIIHLLGSACTTLENSANPQIDASFPCGSVIQ